MRCNNAHENLSLQIDGILPPEKAVELELHLEQCSDCREYFDDLALGRRMLAASEPQLPDNFDWKLQLKLNQALKEAVGETAYPWEEKPVNRWGWLQNFGAAAAVGMAAVLALAIFAGPFDIGQGTNHNRGLNTQPTMAAGVTWRGNDNKVAADRLSLQPMFQSGGGLFGGGSQRNVSTARANKPLRSSSSLTRALQGSSLKDLRTIETLRLQLKHQNRVLFQNQQEIKSLRARLDTMGTGSVDLEDGQLEK